jgi:hypothetical protein
MSVHLKVGYSAEQTVDLMVAQKEHQMADPTVALRAA